MFIRRGRVTRVDNSDIVELTNYIKINVTPTTLDVTAEFSGLFNIICKNEPQYDWFRQQECKLTWNLTFDQLIKDPRANGDDRWDILYPTFPVIDQENLVVPNIRSHFKEISPRHSVIRLHIGPMATSFNQANMIVFTKNETKIECNQHVCDGCSKEGPPGHGLCHSWNYVSKRYDTIKFDEISPDKYRVSWPGIIRPVDMRLSSNAGITTPEFQTLNPGQSIDFDYNPQSHKQATLYFGTRNRILKRIEVSV